MLRTLTVLICFMIIYPTSVLAHPGRTASDGCHYCRTNCNSWGEAWDQRHCHGGYSPPSYTNNQTPSKPNCTQNATYSSTFNTCLCNNGYAASIDKSSCIKIPENAHKSYNGVDIWECDAGYEEINNSCQIITKKENISPNSTKVLKPQASPSEPNDKEGSPIAMLMFVTMGIAVSKFAISKRK